MQRTYTFCTRQNSNAEVNVTIFSKFAYDRCIQCAAIVTVTFSAWFDFCRVQSRVPTSRVYTPSIIAIRLAQTHFVYYMHTCMTIKSGFTWTALNKQAVLCNYCMCQDCLVPPLEALLCVCIHLWSPANQTRLSICLPS